MSLSVEHTRGHGSVEARELPRLSPSMTVLFITTPRKTGVWLAEAFAVEAPSQVNLDMATGASAGMARLHDDLFDLVVVAHEPGLLDALAVVEAHRAGGGDSALVVLGNQTEQEMGARCFQAGADGYLCLHTATTHHLIWVASRALEYRRLLRENHRLRQAEFARRQREHEEADRLLGQQQSLVVELEALRSSLSAPAGEQKQAARPAFAEFPEELVRHYRELLRTYVIMGSGNLACELRRLAEVMIGVGLGARRTMRLHLLVLEELIRGLGTRSTRHVMARADLLVLELMIHLAEGYRGRYQERVHPPVQLVLPGFE